MDNFNQYLQYQKEVAEAKLKIIARLQKGGSGKTSKRTSKINIAQRILDNAGRPLHVTEIIKIAKKEFQIELERDSIVSGIIKKAQAGKTFVRTAPNTFALKQYSSR